MKTQLSFLIFLVLFGAVDHGGGNTRVAKENFSLSVNGNEDLIYQANNSGWSGDGSKNNPYIIENYHFIGIGTLIRLSNIDLYVIIQNNKLENFGNDDKLGILINNSSNIQVLNNEFFDFHLGIVIGASNNLNASNNLFGINIKEDDFTGNNGILISDSFNISIVSNNFSDVLEAILIRNVNDSLILNNMISEGIISVTGLNTTIDSNEIINGGFDIDPRAFENNKFLENKVNNKAILIIHNKSGFEITSGEYGQLFIFKSSNIKIDNLNFIDTWAPVVVEDSVNISIINLILERNEYGIWLRNSNNSIINDNIFTDNGDGLALSLSNLNSVLSNQFISNGVGIALYRSDNNTIIENTFKLNKLGVDLASSRGNLIKDNIFDNNNFNIIDEFGGVFNEQIDNKTVTKTNNALYYLNLLPIVMIIFYRKHKSIIYFLRMK